MFCDRGVKRGEDREALEAQITAYIKYTEATCNHAHFATDFLVSIQIQERKYDLTGMQRNMVRDGIPLPEDMDLDDINGDFEDETSMSP